MWLTDQLKQIELSMLIRTSQVINQNFKDLKYRAACVLQTLSCQRPTLSQVDVQKELFLSDEEVHQGMNYSSSSGTSQSARMLKATSMEELRGMSDVRSGTKLMVTLNGGKMWSFLEKMREFYLPDISEMAQFSSSAAASNGSSSAGSGMPDYNQPAFFKKVIGRSSPYRRAEITDADLLAMPSSHSLHPNGQFSSHSAVFSDGSNGFLLGNQQSQRQKALLLQQQQQQGLSPLSRVMACYRLSAKDVYRFPDIEMNFEALDADSLSENINMLSLYVRPVVEVVEPSIVPTSELQPDGFCSGMDNLKLFNYLLAHYFNPYANRVTN